MSEQEKIKIKKAYDKIGNKRKQQRKKIEKKLKSDPDYIKTLAKQVQKIDEE